MYIKHKINLIILILISLLFITSCNNNTLTTTNTNSKLTNIEDNNMTLKINDTLVNITWENNESVKELKEISKNKLTINMHQYGGFEQVGSIGKTIKSNDTNIKTSPGDVMLYSSNQLVIFYGSNTWDYTKLGHINLSKEELINLLDKDNVILEINI